MSLAFERSMLTRTIGLLKSRSLSVTMKRPLSVAFCFSTAMFL